MPLNLLHDLWREPLAAWNAEELEDHLVDALIDLKFRPDLLKSFVRSAGIPVAA